MQEENKNIENKPEVSPTIDAIAWLLTFITVGSILTGMGFLTYYMIKIMSSTANVMDKLSQ